MNDPFNSSETPRSFSDNSRGHIYTVSTFTTELKQILESAYPFIWIKGEVSNFRKASSGHYYFTLKDEVAQIGAVMFRNQSRHLKFEPNDGLMLIGFGRLNLYEPRGTYQIVFEYIEPDGKGALIAAFEQLKKQLAKEGLFATELKKPLPFIPKKISIVTSPSGAVVYDLINVITRRFPNIHIEIIPVKVQGDGSEDEIVSGLELLNRRSNTSDVSDVIILARGGGSLEDMHAFNSELVARAIFMSQIPVISAIGHETDFTIADFVSDLRAPTPSVAGELVVPLKKELKRTCTETRKALTRSFYNYFKSVRSHFDTLSHRLLNHERKIVDLRMRLEDIFMRLNRIIHYKIQKDKDTLAIQTKMLFKNSPVSHTRIMRDNLKQYENNLFYFIKKVVDHKKFRLNQHDSILNALSPLSILDRGYSITRTLEDRTIIKESNKVSKGQDLEIVLAKGTLIVRNIT